MRFVKTNREEPSLEGEPIRLPAKKRGLIHVLIFALRRRAADGPLGRFIRFAVERHPHFVGEHGPACKVHSTAKVGNAIFNATSGVIIVGEYVFFGHNVSLLAGTHDVSKSNLERQCAIPDAGHDITIERGAWIASGATIIGPCRIGADAVVAAGAVVVSDVPAKALVAGVPARLIKILDVR